MCTHYGFMAVLRRLYLLSLSNILKVLRFYCGSLKWAQRFHCQQGSHLCSLWFNGGFICRVYLCSWYCSLRGVWHLEAEVLRLNHPKTEHDEVSSHLVSIKTWPDDTYLISLWDGKCLHVSVPGLVACVKKPLCIGLSCVSSCTSCLPDRWASLLWCYVGHLGWADQWQRWHIMYDKYAVAFYQENNVLLSWIHSSVYLQLSPIYWFL